MTEMTQQARAQAPRRLSSLVELLAEHPNATLVAGGTDLMVAVNAGAEPDGVLVDLTRVEELHDVEVTHDRVRIGAGVPLARVERELQHVAPGLVQACRTVGSPQIRARATLGGNIVTASPAGDCLPVLVATDAWVELASLDGVRRVPARHLFESPGRIARRPGECVLAVSLPRAEVGAQHFLKVGVRNAMVIAVVSAAVHLDIAGGRLGLGFGSVGPRPMSAAAAEIHAATRLHATGTLDEADLAVIAQLVRGEIRPIDDHRGTASYRRAVAGTLAVRGVRRALEGMS